MEFAKKQSIYRMQSMVTLLDDLTHQKVAEQKPNEQISPTMPPPPVGGSTINPTFVQNNNPPLKYEPQSYFKGIFLISRLIAYFLDLASDPNLFSFNLSSYNFGSETANLEYSILSNMLNTSGLTPTSDAKTDPHSHPYPSSTPHNPNNASPQFLPRPRNARNPLARFPYPRFIPIYNNGRSDNRFSNIPLSAGSFTLKSTPYAGNRHHPPQITPASDGQPPDNNNR